MTIVETPITRAELVHFAQQIMWLAFFAGVLGAMTWAFVAGLVGDALDLLFERIQRNARIKAARARAASGVRGMGQRPMLDPSRTTYPHQGAGGGLVRVSQEEAGKSQAQGPEGRVVKRSEDPRPQTQDQASPDSCLKDKRAGGAPALRCGHGGSGDSVETPSVLEELTLAPSGPVLAPYPVLRRAHGGSGDSVETPSVLEELALAPSGPYLSAKVA